MLSSSSSSAPAIAAALVSRAEELTREWLEELDARIEPGIRRILPSAGLLGPMPLLVRWVSGPPGESSTVPPEPTEVLDRYARHRMGQHVLLEEVLVELGLLEELLQRSLGEEVLAREAGVADALALSRTVGRRIRRAVVVVAAAYSEAVEEQRRDDRGKLAAFTRMVSHEMRDPIGAAFTAARSMEEVDDLADEKVFCRFYRVHADLARGTGLGLVIAREAAEQLGGELVLESVPGVGTSFHFSVPEAERGGEGEDRAGPADEAAA